MIVIFTTNSSTYEEVVKELKGVDHNGVYMKVKGITIHKIPETINGITVNLAFVDNTDALSRLSDNLNREYVYNPCVKAYDLDDTYTAVATFLPEGMHIYT